MSGHSKWAQIKRQKGVADQRRGQLFTKLGREIAVAAREGGPEPEANARLRLAVQRARDANMPMDTIERAIKRGSGPGEGENYEEIAYEGYGPGGVAILVAAMTDNRNRAAAEIRSVFTRNGGNLGESGSVRWQFESRGVLTAEAGERDPDDVALLAIDAGAEDVQIEDGALTVYTTPSDVETIRTALEGNGVKVTDSEVAMIPTTSVPVEARAAEQTMRLIERLEDLDDVQTVYSNADISDEVAASLAG
ncbi:MAG TPA: YebC/PmpR family DNA-binding transcriptional regulator [Chloroflexota bacterium]|nr:YebC/PmpR family DNA-binding transcriptional regulator [Chloroflexota bacterium]